MIIAAREMAWGGKPTEYWGLCFTALVDNSTVYRNFRSDQKYEISTNGRTWKPYTSGAIIRLSKKGSKVYFRAGEGGNIFASGTNNSGRFIMSGKIAASGNIMSLLNGEVATEIIEGSWAFAYLFYQCTSLVSAPELPATTLFQLCYRSMFEGCTSLTEAPELPATALSGGCYWNMFSNCTSLKQAPELPATTLAGDCYNGMFTGCSSLKQAPELPATTLADFCYSNMFRDCTSLVTASELSATTMTTGCYVSMFNGCTSLITAPELPATTLVARCYESMFQGCTNLKSVKVKFKTFSDDYDMGGAGSPTLAWLNNVSPEGVFECYSELGTNETITRGTSACPEGWTVVNEKGVSENRTIDSVGVYSFEIVPTGFIDYVDNYAVALNKNVKADILVVGGGGAGANPGAAYDGGAGGGGAGGMIEAQGVYLEAGSYDIIVGNGGISPEAQGNGGNGESTKILLSGKAKYEAVGGGGGGIESKGRDGGSGGGGSLYLGGNCVSGQGNVGGKSVSVWEAGAGGGGAGSSGKDAVSDYMGADGGEGKSSLITGFEVYYAAGGGGGSRAHYSTTSFGGKGGSGIGGNGAYGTVSVKTSATAGKKNTGSGGGGGCYGQAGGAGGSGIVVIRVTEVLD